MPFFFFDPTFVLLIPALILAVWAQAKVKSAYAHYSRIGVRSGMTGAEAAQRILREAGITLTDMPESVGGPACALNVIPGQMTDHYDPRNHALNLSEGVYYGRSIAAIGIAAHEVGHAIQHARQYAPLTLRNVVYPVCNIGSTLAFPLFIIGILGGIPVLMDAAILLFSFAVFFTVLTLPVEFNASRRAVAALEQGGYVDVDELQGVRKVLTAAAMTYVAAAAMALMNLVRLLVLRRD
ncbi:MAG TPA: zinc metallopeptidase [Candidatus Hydrogenedentes bacterium]|nr:zinc metallopeptidase [Candidatus Hydrogenedentota bacterium]